MFLPSSAELPLLAAAFFMRFKTNFMRFKQMQMALYGGLLKENFMTNLGMVLKSL